MQRSCSDAFPLSPEATMAANRRFGMMAAATAAALGASLTTPGAAQAHPSADYYTYLVWPATAVENYQIAGGVPQIDRVRATIRAGAGQWNLLFPGSTFEEIGYSSQAPYVFPQCDPVSRSFVFQRDISDPDILGEAFICGTLSANLRADAFWVTFDNRSWHSNVLSDPPPDAFDRYSVATHEMGHAMGHWEHWPSASPRCEEVSNKLSMCPTVAPGSTMMRSIDDHDIHTFENTY
jgi:hypothetical protein